MTVWPSRGLRLPLVAVGVPMVPPSAVTTLMLGAVSDTLPATEHQ